MLAAKTQIWKYISDSDSKFEQGVLCEFAI